jgi:hypothetical protein
MRRRRSESNLKINQNRKTTGWTTLSVKIWVQKKCNIRKKWQRKSNAYFVISTGIIASKKMQVKKTQQKLLGELFRIEKVVYKHWHRRQRR